MKILCITDCHFGEDSNFSAHGGEHYINIYGSQFESYFSRLKPRFEAFDLVVNLGDSINDHSFIHGQSEESYQVDIDRFKQFLSFWEVCKIPVFHVLGNHDGATIPRSDFELLLNRKTYFAESLHGFRHLVLDPIWGEYPFRLDSTQLDWLQGELNTGKEPIIVYIHTPCDEQDLSDNYYHRENPSRYFTFNRKTLRGMFEDSGRVKLVLQGHSHFYSNQNINGIKYLTLPSFLENDTSGQPSGAYVELSIDSQSPHSAIIQQRRVRLH